MVFVPAVQDSPQTRNPSSSKLSGEQYLSIVLKHKKSLPKHGAKDAEALKDASEDMTEQLQESKGTICRICNLPLDGPPEPLRSGPSPHETSIAHMVCLKHSDPPSDIDRTRLGLKYLSSYGWDPDSRRGLGSCGRGIRAPIKAKIKNDTVGLGVHFQEGIRSQGKKELSLNAKQARMQDSKNKQKREHLQELFYGKDNLNRILGCEQ